MWYKCTLSVECRLVQIVVMALVNHFVYLSYSTVVPYIIRIMGVHTFSILTKTSLNYNTFTEPWQYWLGAAKPKSTFSATKNASNKLLQKIIKLNFLLTDYLTNTYLQTSVT